MSKYFVKVKDSLQQRKRKAYTVISNPEDEEEEKEKVIPYKMIQQTVNDEYDVEIETQKRKDYYAEQKNLYDTLANFASFLGLVFAIIDYETNYIYPRESYEIPNTTRLMVAFTTILCIIFHVIKRWYKFKIFQKVCKEIKRMKTPTRIFPHIDFISMMFILELIITLIQPLPFYDPYFEIHNINGDYQLLLSEILYSIMFFRIFLFIRSYLLSTIYTDGDAKKLCGAKYGFSANARFAIKCITKKFPLSFAFLLVFGSILMFAVELRIYERPFWSEQENLNGTSAEMDFGNFGNCVWCTIITMCTVGYGDFAPKTIGGRTISSLCALGGGIITTILIVVMTDLLTLSQDQKKAFYTLSLSQEAGRAITSFFVYNRINKNPHSNYLESRQAYKKFRTSLHRFVKAQGIAQELSLDIVTREERMLREMQREISKLQFDMDVLIDCFGNMAGPNRTESIDPERIRKPKRHLTSIVDFLIK